jgi:hypothetical protein
MPHLERGGGREGEGEARGGGEEVRRWSGERSMPHLHQIDRAALATEPLARLRILRKVVDLETRRVRGVREE